MLCVVACMCTPCLANMFCRGNQMEKPADQPEAPFTPEQTVPLSPLVSLPWSSILLWLLLLCLWCMCVCHCCFLVSLPTLLVWQGKLVLSFLTPPDTTYGWGQADRWLAGQSFDKPLLQAAHLSDKGGLPYLSRRPSCECCRFINCLHMLACSHPNPWRAEVNKLAWFIVDSVIT